MSDYPELKVIPSFLTIAGPFTPLPSLSTCSKLRTITVQADFWPFTDATKAPTGNFRTFRTALAIFRSALSAQTLRHVELVFFLRHDVLTVPESMVIPKYILPRLEELNWAQFNDVFSATVVDRLESLHIRLDASRIGKQGPWLAEDLEKLLETKLTTCLRELARYD